MHQRSAINLLDVTGAVPALLLSMIAFLNSLEFLLYVVLLRKMLSFTFAISWLHAGGL